MLIKYYYLRDEENKPRITICAVYDSIAGIFARGVAMCSEKDNPNKRVGRNIALQRAVHALANRTDACPIERLDQGYRLDLAAIDAGLQKLAPFKASFAPPMNAIERKLFRLDEMDEITTSERAVA